MNSEHEKNLQNDYWRLSQVEKFTSDPDHDYSKFGTGNKDTLDIIPKEKGISVRDSLLEFHKKYYSANIMALSLLGKGKYITYVIYMVILIIFIIFEGA